MNLIMNGERKSLQAERLTIQQLLDRADLAGQTGVAVAVNNSVIPRSQWENHGVVEGDHIEIIRATQGG